jgi:acylphosphatase
VVAHGEVQGVFFRASVARLANQLGVAGYAHNRDDGAVEMAFEGQARAVEQLIAYSADGPERANVSRLEVDEEPPQGDAGFRTG